MPYVAIALFLVAGLCLSSLDTTAKYLVRDQSLLIAVIFPDRAQRVTVLGFTRNSAATSDGVSSASGA